MKAANISFEKAASLPLAFQSTVIEGFKTAGFKGQSIFVVGGGVGVGTLVVHLAKQQYNDSEVVGSCSTGKVEFVKSLAVDRVIDYTATKYEEIYDKSDVVYDAIGESMNTFVVAKEDALVVDITWPPAHPKATYSSLTVTGESLEEFRPYFESGQIKAETHPSGPYLFNGVMKKAFGHL